MEGRGRGAWRGGFADFVAGEEGDVCLKILAKVDLLVRPESPAWVCVRHGMDSPCQWPF